jgi:hypothetical protein
MINANYTQTSALRRINFSVHGVNGALTRGKSIQHGPKDGLPNRSSAMGFIIRGVGEYHWPGYGCEEMAEMRISMRKNAQLSRYSIKYTIHHIFTIKWKNGLNEHFLNTRYAFFKRWVSHQE